MIHIVLLIIGAVMGVIFMGHGAQKLFGWFGGYGIKGTGGRFNRNETRCCYGFARRIN